MTPACADRELLLNAFIDGELDAANTAELEAHVAGCGGCREELDRLRSVHDALATPGVRHEMPAGTKARLLSSIDRDPVRAPRMASWWAPALGGAIAASLATAFLLPLEFQPGLEAELIAGHVRSLQVQHLTDVATSNEHLVRPWFNGKIDFAPPVPELASVGFPLAGGRLDYLEGRNVPAIVYRRRLHVINLFVWPAKDAGEKRVERDGYSVSEWSEGGLRYAAVSDISPQELEQFRAAFMKATAVP
jgi:anti-sigma factor RsiW